MISKLRDFFVNNIAVEQIPESSEKIEERIAIATCVLMLEMAHSDNEFSDIEEDAIKTIMQSEFGLTGNTLDQIVALAHEEREESLDLWQFTNLIKENYSKEQKIKVIENIWRVVYADDKVDKYEEYLVRKLSYLLNVDHKDMIDAKLNVKYGKKDE